MLEPARIRKLNDHNTADRTVKICPECGEGWERVTTTWQRLNSSVHYYGPWRNLGLGKEKKICPKCE